MATGSARRALVLLPLLAAAGLVAGCGGNGPASSAATVTTRTAAAPAPVERTQHLVRQAYVRRMRQLGQRLGKAVEGVYPIDTGTAHSQISRETMVKLEKARVAVESVLGSLRQIVPPPAVRADHRQLERGVSGIAVDMQAVVDALRTGDLSASIEPAGLPSLRVVTAATDRMEAAGYDVLGRGNAGAS